MTKYTEENNWYGKWLVDGDTRLLVEPSSEYIASKEQSEVLPEPTQEEYMMDLDYRLSVIELGL